ncbi:MAG: RHS repeat-associated core domain-containing protein [Acidimicrobiales bacterium]
MTRRHPPLSGARAPIVGLISLLLLVGLPLLPGGHFAPKAKAQTYDQLVRSDAAAAYWRLGESASEAVAREEVRSDGRHIGYIGGEHPSVPGAILNDANRALNFGAGGITSIGINNGTDFEYASWTVEGWFKVSPGAMASGGGFIYSSGGWEGANLSMGADGRVSAHSNVNDYGPPARARSGTSFDDGAWHYVTATHDQITLRLFVDGGLVGIATTGVPTVYEGRGTRIGLWSYGPSGPFVGDLDEIAVYDHPLTQAQIQAHYTTAGYTLRPVGGAIEPRETLGGGCGTTAPHVPAVQRSVGQPVNTATGNFWHTFDDLSVPSRGLDLDFRHTYNSLNASLDGPLGYGWTHSYADSLSFGVGGTVTVRQCNGAELFFRPAGSGYSAPPRVTATLVHNPDATWSVTTDAGQVSSFDAAGRLVARRDHNGYVTHLNYTGSQLTGIVADADLTPNANNRSLALTYEGPHIKTVRDGEGRMVTFFYEDGAGNLTKVVDANGGVTRMTYTAHRLSKMLNPNQDGAPNPIWLENHYDGSGRVDWQTDFLGRRTSFDYTTTLGSTIVTDPQGKKTVYEYRSGLLRTETRGKDTAEQATWTYEYEPATLGLASVIDPNQHRTSMTYDALGNLLTRTDPLNRTTTFEYNDPNYPTKPTKVTDAKQVATTYAYLGGNLLTVSTPLVEDPGYMQRTEYRYEDAAHPGDVTGMVDANAKAWRHTYNPWGDLASVTDPVTPTPGRITYCYDNAARLESQTSPKGAATANCDSDSQHPTPFTTYFTYNGFGQVRTATDPLGHQTVNEYYPEGNLKTTRDPNGNLTTYSYNGANELTQELRPDLTHIDYDYRLDGLLWHRWDGAHQPTTYDYDGQGRLRSEMDATQRETKYGYDPAGNRVTKTDPGGSCPAWPIVYPPSLSPAAKCTVMGYDAADQLTSVAYSDAVTPNVTNVVYDGDGQRTAMTDGSGTSTWRWDSLHRLMESSVGGQLTTYGYVDASGNRNLVHDPSSVTYPGANQVVRRAYDEAGQLRFVTDWASRTTEFRYDADGFMTTTLYPNGVVSTSTPDGADRLMSITTAKNTATLASFAYGRDNADQVTSVTTAGTAGLVDTHAYAPYTPLNQVQKLDGATAWTYDAADNLRSIPGATLTPDPVNQLQTLTRGSGSVSFGYDSRGNRTSASAPQTTTTYAYDQASRLTSADIANVSGTTSVGWYHSLASRTDGTVWAWGHNAYGQVGDGTTAQRNSPVAVPGLADVVAVAGAAYQSAALLGDGTVWAWGGNWAGQLGDGTTVERHAPVQVQGLSGVRAIAAGSSHFLALKDDGTVWAWGYNANGQLGDGTTQDRNAPVAVLGLSGVVAIAGGYAHSVALRADGTVWAWGHNGFGQLGDNTTTERRTPVQVQQLSGVRAIASGYFHVLAAKADGGSVWAWGYNAYGQLGNNTTADQRLPVLVAGLSGVSSVAANGYSSAALRSDGTVRAWGYNANGQLGDGTTLDRRTPVAVSGLSNVRGLAMGPNNGLTIKRDDAAAMAWGWNGSGAVGDGTTTNRLAAVAAGSFTGKAPRATYTYNGDGLRSSKNVAGRGPQSFAWDQAAGVGLVLTDGDRSYVYGPGGLPIAQVDATGNVTYLHQDQIGSTRLLTDGSGAVVATFTYDPYGRRGRATGPATTPLRYAGEYTDAETGFVYLRARYYDPATGQFISRDPLEPITGTPYAYAGNDPLNFTDPSGLVRIPGTNICVDIADPNCRSIKEQHQEGAQQVANIAGGVLNTLTFGNERRINSALGQEDKVDRCSGWYDADEYAGYAVDAVNVAAAGRELFSKVGLRIAGSRMARAHIDEDVHAFQMFGREFLQPHVQVDTWQAGVKGSGSSFRIPLPKWLF